jgi:hypothetical protein
MTNYLELFAKAIGMPRPIERSPYELERDKEELASNQGQKMDSTSKESSKEKETRKTEPKKRPIDIHEHYHG